MMLAYIVVEVINMITIYETEGNRLRYNVRFENNGEHISIGFTHLEETKIITTS